MRGSGVILAFAAVSAAGALALVSCKYASTYPPLPFPSPSLAPTFAPGIVNEIAVPTSNATPVSIAEGPDGNMWFTEINGNRVGFTTPVLATPVELAPLPTSNSIPIDIIAAPFGLHQVWFVESGSSKIGVVNTDSRSLVAEYSTPTGNAGPSGLAIDPSGNLWFGEFNVGQLAKITTGGSITEYNLASLGCPSTQPDAVAVTSDGTVWFLDFANNAIGKVTGGGSGCSEVAIPSPASVPENVVVGPDGNLYFTEASSGKIGKVNVSLNPPAVLEYTTPTSISIATVPWGITVSPLDHDVWFSEVNAGQVGRITTGGVITEWGIPGAGTTAIGIAPGPDVVSGAPNDIWFTDGDLNGLPANPIGTNQIGKINIGAVPALGAPKTFSALMRARKLGHIPVHGPWINRRY